MLSNRLLPKIMENGKSYILQNKMDKATYHIENSYRSISLTNIFGKIYERILLQQATNIWEKNKFFEGKNLYAYQKNKNAPQALLPLVEQMHEAIANGEYGIVIMADLEGAFDSVWREGALYKLHIAGINSNLLAVLSSFLTDRVCKIFVNSYQGPWLETQLSVPQGSLLSPLIFLVYTSDLTLEEEKPQSQVKLKPQESKYADHVEFWRTHKNYYQLLINIQLAIVNLQSWCYKWRISLNISKKNCMVFSNKKKKPSPPSIPVTINEIPLKQVQTKRVLGIMIDENLTFTSHIENITIKCEQA